MCSKGVYCGVGLKARWALLMTGLTLLTQIPAFAAGSVTLAWDASPDPSVTGYRIYIGGASGNYTNSANVGNVTSTVLTNLTEGATYYFAATAYDATGVESDFSNEANYTVTTTPGNVTPTLNIINAVTISEDAAAQTINLSGISSGSVDEEQTLTVTATSSNPGLIPHPSVNYSSPNATGSLNFTPTANGFGSATITVTVNDGQAVNNLFSHTFTVTVSPVNDVPTLNPINNLTINEDAAVQTVNLSGISPGVANENQTLIVTAVSSNPGLIANPTVNYASPNAAGSLSFAPVANANGSATITVTVNDGQAANNIVTQTFTVTVNPVNDAPTLNNLVNVSIPQNAGAQAANLSGITSGAANETQTLVVTAVSSNPGLIPNPTVTYTSPNGTGSLSFAPVANATGSATITVTVNDGQAANNTVTRTFIVTVTPVNQPPTLDAIANLTMDEDASAQLVALSGISSGAANENQTLTLTATSSNPTLLPNPAISYASPNATGSLTLTPAANAHGVATITVTVNDGQSTNNTVVRTFTATVNPVNDAPTLNSLVNLNIGGNAGTQIVNLSGISSGAANENQSLSVTATSSNPSLIPDPILVYTSPNATGSLSFAPAANENGSAIITVTVNDGQSVNNTFSRSFTVNVNVANNPPTLAAISNVSIAEDASTQTVNLTGISAGSGENQTLTVTAISANPALIPNPTVNYSSPNPTGTLNFAPVADATGSTTITVTVNDGMAISNTVSRTFTVNVTPVNDAPALNAIANVAVDEDAGPQVVALSGISTGASNETQTLTITATSSNPSLIPNPTLVYTSPNATGALNFTPVANANGTATITVTVNDGQAVNNTVVRTFTITVNPVNDAPTFNAIANLTVSGTAGQQTVNLSGINSGAANETQVLSVTATSSNPGLVPHPTVNYSTPNATGSLVFTPANTNGTATITVTVNDGQAENNTFSRSFVVTVSEVNTAPTISPIANVTVVSGTNSGPIGFTIGDAQTPASALTLSASSSNPSRVPVSGITFGGSGANRTVSVTAAPGVTGTANVTITVNDGAASTNRMFTVTVTEPPDVVGQLSVTKTGQGTVTPDLTTTELIVGQTYTVTASPASGYYFSGWSGSVVSSSPTITFTMTANTILQANFVADPYVAATGTYNGLFNEADEVRLHSAGGFNVYLDSKGNYSAWVQIGATRSSFSGKMSLDLRSTNTVTRGNGLNPLTVELQIGQGGAAGQIVGRVTDGVWSANLSGGRAAAAGDLAGQYTIVVPGVSGDASKPAGDGYATMFVATDGLVTMSATMADGTQFSQSGHLTADRDWPLFAPMYVGKGAAMSWLSFTNQSTSDVNGNLVWIKQAAASATSFPLGFTNGTKAVGSFYNPNPESGKAVNLAGAVVSFSGGSLGTPFNNVISYNAGNEVVNLSPNELTLRVTKVTGTFSGTVREPGSDTVRNFGGVLLQKQNAGYGTLFGESRGSRTVLAAP
jgi:hypothetical protein